MIASLVLGVLYDENCSLVQYRPLRPLRKATTVALTTSTSNDSFGPGVPVTVHCTPHVVPESVQYAAAGA